MATACLVICIRLAHTQWLLISEITARNMISRTSEIPDLPKYATKASENGCLVDLEGGKLCLSYLLAVISEKMFASYVFPDKNQKPLRMCRMQITKQAVAIFPLISGNENNRKISGYHYFITNLLAGRLVRK